MSKITNMTKRLFHSTSLFTMTLIVVMAGMVGCSSPKGDTSSEKRTYVNNMRAKALQQLYRLEPQAKSEIAAAPGYGVFDSVQTQFIITTTGNGYGIIHDNRTGRDTYMAGLNLGGGLGVGIKSYKSVVIFRDAAFMKQIIDDGWTIGGSGTADAKIDKDGATISGSTAFNNKVKIYTFTKSGLMAGVSLRGGKIWKDKDLN